MSTINVSCTDQVLTYSNMPVIASGGVNTDKIHFTFDSSWGGYTKMCVFYKQSGAYFYGLLDSNNDVSIPYHASNEPGTMCFAVSGCSGSTVKTSNVLSYRIVEGAYTAGLDDGYSYINFRQALDGKANLEHDHEPADIIGLHEALASREFVSNKIIELTENATDTQYPSAKCVYDTLTGLQQALHGEIVEVNTVAFNRLVRNSVPVTPNNVSYAISQFFLYTGETTNNYTNGHIYQIVRSGTEGSYTYSAEDLTPDSGGGGTTDLTGYEETSNKVTELTSSSTDTQYPSAKCVYDTFDGLSDSLMTEIISADRGRIGLTDIMPTSRISMQLGFAACPYFIYTGETSGNNVNGHLYEIRKTGDEYSVVDLTPVSSGSGGDTTGCELLVNKLTGSFFETEITTDTQYPSAKAVQETLAAALEGLSSVITSRVATKSAISTGSQLALGLQKALNPYFIFTGETSDTMANGHLYEIVETEGVYSVVDLTPDAGGGSGGTSDWQTETMPNFTTALTPADKTEYILTNIEELAITVNNTVQCKIDITFFDTCAPVLTLSPLSYAIEGDSVTDIVAGDRVIILLDKGVCYLNILEAA